MSTPFFPATNRRRFLRSSALAAPFLLLRRARAASLRRFPYIQNLSSTDVTVLWTTDSPCEGEVRFSTDLSFSQSASSRATELSPAETALDSSYWRHRAVLRNLEPGTRYNYQVRVDGQPVAASFNLTFHTPASSGPFSFLAFGDSGVGSGEQIVLRERMMQETPDFVLHTGDIAYPVGSFESFQQNYLDVYRDLMYRVPFFPAAGNHGYMTANAFPHLSIHDVPANDVPSDLGRYYSFDWCGCHVIALDSNAPLSAAARGTGQMLRWLENDLKRASNRFWKIVFFHHPPYGFGPNERDVLTGLAREHIVPILERHGVQLVLNGHEHSYQRSHSIRGNRIVEHNRGTTYITTGGGGNGVYPVHPNPLVTQARSAHHYLRVRVERTRLTVEAVGLGGEVFDRVDLAPQPEFSASSIASLNAEPGRHAANGIVSIFGSSMARRSETADLANPGTELGGISVAVDGRDARILFASPSQINAVLPGGIQGDVEIRVRNANGETSAPIRVSRSAPGIVVVAHQDGTPVTPESPAGHRERLLIYAAGLGRSESVELSQNAPTLAVDCDADSVDPEEIGTASATVGLHQVRFRVPAGAGPKLAIRLRTADAISPAVVIDVR